MKWPPIALPGPLPCWTAVTLPPPTGSQFRAHNTSPRRSLRAQEGDRRDFPDFALARQTLKAFPTDGVRPAPLRKSVCHVIHPSEPGPLDPCSRKVLSDACGMCGRSSSSSVWSPAGVSCWGALGTSPLSPRVLDLSTRFCIQSPR
ncbi:hypothetical protein HJG60_008561 [Phyllostomus discolor]|uniref:Uncharacterized protein n=1 Tax=Phyllostomus discolor TaxID=89673 RepID=A0A833Z111_9CHIR|nr:hypothetical protein HJG60_008561 [Phyllostomus discolor]